MEFSPDNHVVKLCLQGMALEGKGETGAAGRIFLQAWNEATDDFEKFIAAHYVARVQENASDRLHWLDKALECGLKVNNDAARSALPSLYSKIAQCYDELKEADKAKAFYESAGSLTHIPTDKGPFYHGTKAALRTGDLLKAGGNSNYKDDLKMNHIYFTALINGAGLAAALAKGEGPERVYMVEPTGSFEHDPNVTDKKFPGNPTRSYRSEAPLKIVGEVTDWARQTAEDIKNWRDKLAKSKGEIIN